MRQAPSTTRLKIDERTGVDGSLASVWLAVDADDTEWLQIGGPDSPDTAEPPLCLPAGAVCFVMRRYGTPLDERQAIRVVNSLELGDGRTLRHVRHLGFYDVIARDYLILEGDGDHDLVALATNIAGALEHLARAAELKS